MPIYEIDVNEACAREPKNTMLEMFRHANDQLVFVDDPSWDSFIDAIGDPQMTFPDGPIVISPNFFDVFAEEEFAIVEDDLLTEFEELEFVPVFVEDGAEGETIETLNPDDGIH